MHVFVTTADPGTSASARNEITAAYTDQPTNAFIFVTAADPGIATSARNGVTAGDT